MAIKTRPQVFDVIKCVVVRVLPRRASQDNYSCSSGGSGGGGPMNANPVVPRLIPPPGQTDKQQEQQQQQQCLGNNVQTFMMI